MKEITTEKNILTENSELLQKYFKDIGKYPIYKGEEQIELAIKMRNGDMKAREQLINSNLRFVVTCAKQFVGQGVPLIDLINSGNLGLIQSVERYDPSKGYHFISYAVWYIRREILRAIYNTGRTIRYPITYITKITKVKKAYEEFINKYQREPTDEELINLTNITQKQYDSVVLNKSYCQSIDTPITDDGKTTIENVLAFS
jgi:RNA polymerase primary sigma factor